LYPGNAASILEQAQGTRSTRSLKELKNPYARKKKAVGINLSPEVVDYFKRLAEETGLPYQKLIDLYLLDCARKRKKLTMKWVA
jgi:predicted DNA binding CopG/RHH family protein